MSYFPKGHHPTGDEVDDFNEYDPTPYGGGYDISLTYGRTLPPSEGICYPNSSSDADYFDYNRPQYASHDRPSAYAAKALENEYKSYARHEPRPFPEPPAGGFGCDGPKPNYGFQPSGYSGRPEPFYGSGYSGKPEFERPGSEYGAGYGSKPDASIPEYGPRPDYPQPGYPRIPEPDYGWRRGPVEFARPEYGAGYGRKPDARIPEYGPRPDYPQPGYPRMPEPNYGWRPGPVEFARPEHGPSGFVRRPGPEEYDRRGDDHYGYGHKKYGYDNPDEEEKHRHNQHHHHHRKQ